MQRPGDRVELELDRVLGAQLGVLEQGEQEQRDRGEGVAETMLQATGPSHVGDRPGGDEREAEPEDLHASFA